MKDLAPDILRESTKLGVLEIGKLLGVDSRISQLASIGISSTLGGSYMRDPITGNWKFDAGKMWSSFQSGLLQGVASVGLNYATKELGLNPLLANIGFSAISTAINAGIQASIGPVDPDTGQRKDFFTSIFDAYKANALAFLGYADPKSPGYAWQQSAYIAQIQDFSKIVMERGLVEALDTYATGFFNATAVNSIVRSGYTIGEYFAGKLNSGDYKIRSLPDGKQVKEVSVEDSQNNVVAKAFFKDIQEGNTRYLDLLGQAYTVGEDVFINWGDLGVDAYNRLGYTDADIYSVFDSDTQFQRIKNGQQTYAEIKDNEGNTIFVVTPGENGGYNYYNSVGDYEDAIINVYKDGYKISLKDSVVDRTLQANLTRIVGLPF